MNHTDTPQQRPWKRKRPSSRSSSFSTTTTTTTTRRLSLALALAILLLLATIIPSVRGLTYDNDPRDLSEPATHHVKTKRRTRVSMDDLNLGEMEAAEAAQQVMGRIGVKVRRDSFWCSLLSCDVMMYFVVL